MLLSFDQTDNYGNRLFTQPEKKEGKLGAGNGVFLRLVSEKRRRQLGRIVVGETTGSTVFAKHIGDDHIMQVNRSIGFCDELLRHLPEKAILVVHWNGRVLYLDLPEARRVGSYLHFKHQGFERQFFVPLANFKLKD